MAVTEKVEPWELHSELVLVSPEVCRRALELLPERDPDAYLARLRDADGDSRGLIAEILLYTVWRSGRSARFGLAVIVGSVGIALIAEALH